MNPGNTPLFDKLTESEKWLFLELCKVPDDTLWGMAICNCLEKPTLTNFRSLKTQLKSQAKDNPLMMHKIIGHKAYHALMFKR